jgi:hypothetical protein
MEIDRSRRVFTLGVRLMVPNGLSSDVVLLCPASRRASETLSFCLRSARRVRDKAAAFKG